MLETSMCRRTTGVFRVGFGLGALLLAQSAFGQQGIFVTSDSVYEFPAPSIGAAGGSRNAGAVGKSALGDYGRLLGLSDDQRAMIESLHEGYQATYRVQRDEQSKAMRDVMSEFRESEDMTILQEQVPALRKKYSDAIAANEGAFFEDLKLVLTDSQLEQFPRVERHRRRETLLRRGFLSGESVDLIDLVNDLEFSPEVNAAIADELGTYEIDIDRAILAKRALSEGDTGVGSAFSFSFGDEETQERAEKTREASVRVRSVNEGFARRIQGLLPEVEAARFVHAFDVAAFPDVYQPTHAMKCIEAAQGFADLTADQSEQLFQIRESYQRDAAAINERWARAKRLQEEDGNRNAFMSADGGQVMIVMRAGDSDEEATKDPVETERKAKRDLDTRTSEKLASVLSSEQVTRLPEVPKQSEGGQSFTTDGGHSFGFSRTIEINGTR